MTPPKTKRAPQGKGVAREAPCRASEGAEKQQHDPCGRGPGPPERGKWADMIDESEEEDDSEKDSEQEKEEARVRRSREWIEQPPQVLQRQDGKEKPPPRKPRRGRGRGRGRQQQQQQQQQQ